MAEATERNARKVRQGIVSSIMGNKSIVVTTTERKRHPKYGKMMTSTKKFHVHDEENTAGVGDTVRIMETRPLSATKRWRLVEIIERAKQIGTYEISCQTAPDCCTLFMPRRPETHAKLDAVHEAWNMFDHETMIDYLVEHVEYVDFTAVSYTHLTLPTN